MKTMRFIGIVLALFSAGSPPAAQAQDSGKKYKVYMVSNSHLDTQWRWDVKATIDDYLYNTAVQNLALLENIRITCSISKAPSSTNGSRSTIRTSSSASENS